MTLVEIKPDTFCTDVKLCKKTDSEDFLSLKLLKAPFSVEEFAAKSLEEKNAIMCEVKSTKCVIEFTLVLSRRALSCRSSCSTKLTIVVCRMRSLAW